jgi:ketosteroid isomerase-like protein
MSQENVEIVRAIYDAWAKQASAAHLIAADIEYVNPPYAVESGTRHDRKALASVQEVYPDFRVEPDRYIDANEDVVVIGLATGTGASGIRFERRQAHLWTIRDGKAIRFCWFNDPAEALEAAGLEG